MRQTGRTFKLGLLVMLGVLSGRPEVSGAAPMSLEQMIEVALSRNPDVSASRWNGVVASAERDIAKAQRLPAVKLRGGYSYQSESQRLFPATYSGETGVFGKGLLHGEVVVSVPLYTGGRISSEIAASELLQRAAAGELARTREVVVFNVTSLFYSMLAQEEVVRSVDSAMAAMEEQRRTILELVDAQKAARVDVLRTEVRLAELKDQKTKELNVLTVQRWALAALLGMEDVSELELSGQLELPSSSACADGVACLQSAMNNRADYTAAQERVLARAEKVKSARSTYRPTLSLEAGYGMRSLTDIDDNDADSDETVDVGWGGLVAEWSLFAGGGNRAKVREQMAGYQLEQERERKLRLSIRTEVETALAGVASAKERVETTTASVAQARESFRIIKEKYELGKGAMVDVLTAQAAVVFAETSLVRAKADLAISDAQRKLAVGMMIQ